jgi:hypothetical protein
MPWMRRDKLQPSAVSASALVASSYRFHLLHVSRSCLSTRSLDCARFVQLDTKPPICFSFAQACLCALSRIESWVAHKHTVAVVFSCPLTSDGANPGPVPCHCGRQRRGASCGCLARLVRLVFVVLGLSLANPASSAPRMAGSSEGGTSAASTASYGTRTVEVLAVAVTRWCFFRPSCFCSRQQIFRDHDRNLFL